MAVPGTPPNEWTTFLGNLPRIRERDVEEWGQVATAGILAGMMYGGAKEASATHTDYLTKFQSTSMRATQRELMEQRLVHIVRGSVRGGAQLGLVGAIFSGTQLTLGSFTNNRHPDRWCTAAAGVVTGAAMGLVGRGPALTRLQSALGFGITGAAIAFPLGMLQDYLRALLPEPGPEKEVSCPSNAVQEVADAIERLQTRFGTQGGSEDEKERQ